MHLIVLLLPYHGVGSRCFFLVHRVAQRPIDILS